MSGDVAGLCIDVLGDADAVAVVPLLVLTSREMPYGDVCEGAGAAPPPPLCASSCCRAAGDAVDGGC